ncbi:MAG TPA: hypothetical protein VLC09_08350, partial [Polyangiaceae bacterium]|nr:hypothetical protein [Polyangiaceae bacterium]
MIRGLRPLAFAGLGLACAALGLACAAPHPRDATPHTQAAAAAPDATPQESAAVAPPGPLDGPAPTAREFTARGGLRVLVEAHPERLLAELSWEFAADERVESERLLLQYLLGLQPPTGASTDGAVHFERCALARLCASLDRRQLERLLPAWLERTEPTREALERAKQATIRELARMESEPASSLDDLARAILDGSRGGPWGSQLVESWGEKQLRARLNAVLATARLRISGPLVPEAVERRWASTAAATSAAPSSATSTPAAPASTPTRGAAWMWLDVDR